MTCYHDDAAHARTVCTRPSPPPLGLGTRLALLLSGESDNLRTTVIQSIPTIDTASSVFCPSWACYEGILYKSNNCFLTKVCDGLDPVFVEISVIGNKSSCNINFIVQECKILYFEDHYHSYARELLPAKSVVYLEGLYDRTVLHGHTINSIVHVGLKYYFCQIYRLSQHKLVIIILHTCSLYPKQCQVYNSHNNNYYYSAHNVVCVSAEFIITLREV